MVVEIELPCIARLLETLETPLERNIILTNERQSIEHKKGYHVVVVPLVEVVRNILTEGIKTAKGREQRFRYLVIHESLLNVVGSVDGNGSIFTFGQWVLSDSSIAS